MLSAAESSFDHEKPARTVEHEIKLQLARRNFFSRYHIKKRRRNDDGVLTLEAHNDGDICIAEGVKAHIEDGME